MKSELKFASYFNWLWTPCPFSDTKYISLLIIAIMLTHVLGSGAGDIMAACDNPELTNTTWEQIDNPDAVGWSAEKLREACEYVLKQAGVLEDLAARFKDGEAAAREL